MREALQRLQTDGWIELRPAQGAFVHVPSVGRWTSFSASERSSRRIRQGSPPTATPEDSTGCGNSGRTG